MMWRAVHIFLHEIYAQNNLLLEFVLPYMSENKIAQENWFFIRYWDGGPHIRLRVKTGEDQFEKLLKAIDLWLSKQKFEQILTREMYYVNNTFDGNPVDVSTLKWYKNGSYQVFPYEPELDRYGGEKLISVCEEIFHLSSQYAMDAHMLMHENNIKIEIPFGIEFMKKLVLHAMVEEKKFYTYAFERWKVFEKKSALSRENFLKFYKISEKIKISNEMNAQLREKINKIHNYIKDEAYYFNIILSLSHMNFNRMSIYPALEYEIYKNMVFLIKEGDLM